MATETFTDRMLDKTLGRAVQPKRGQNYNYPLRWFARTDGEIVQLQSDPQARAYYADKGYHLLAESPARGETLSEVEEWERLERPKLIEQQIRKAKLINAIRRTESKDPTLGALIDVDDLDDRTVEDLEQVIKDIRAQGGTVRLSEARRRPQPEEQRSEDLLRGVERAETNSLEDLQRKLSAEGAQARTIGGTGHDPIEENRRRKS